mgnify:CR=1 FL=1
MSLEKKITVDMIEVTEGNFVQVRTKTAIIENGEQISDSFHRHVIAPGEDYSAEDARVQVICAVVQTPEVIAEYQAQQLANQPVGA